MSQPMNFWEYFDPKLIGLLEKAKYEDGENKGKRVPVDNYDTDSIEKVFDIILKNPAKYGVDADILGTYTTPTQKHNFLKMVEMARDGEAWYNSDGWEEYDRKAREGIKQINEEEETAETEETGPDAFVDGIGERIKELEEIFEQEANGAKKVDGVFKNEYVFNNLLGDDEFSVFVREYFSRPLNKDNISKFVKQLHNKDPANGKIMTSIVAEYEKEQAKKEEAQKSTQTENDLKQQIKDEKDKALENAAKLSNKNKDSLTEITNLRTDVDPILDFFNKYKTSLAETVGRHDIYRLATEANKSEIWKMDEKPAIEKLKKDFPQITDDDYAKAVLKHAKTQKMNEIFERRKKMEKLSKLNKVLPLDRMNKDELKLFDEDTRKQFEEYQREKFQELERQRNIKFMPARQFVKYERTLVHRINPLLYRGNGRREFID